MKKNIMIDIINQAEKLVIEKWAKELNEKGEIMIRGFGTFKVLPRREGKVNGFVAGYCDTPVSETASSRMVSSG